MERITTTSLFSGYKKQVCTPIEWVQVHQLITGGTLRDATEKHRVLRDNGCKAEADLIKQNAPCITPAVSCRGGRRIENIERYTLISMVDFDEVPQPEHALRLLHADPHAFLIHTTYSGHGIRVFFPYSVSSEKPVDQQLYQQAFQTGNSYFAQLTGLKPDPSCKNPARLSALCHDEHAFFHPDAQAFILAEAPPASIRKCASDNVRTAILKAIEKQLSETGIIYEAGHHNEYIMRTGYLLNEFGVDETKAVQWACYRFADYGTEQVKAILTSCYQKTASHGTRSLPQGEERNHSKQASVEAIEQFLTTQAHFRFNLITRQCEIRLLSEDSFKELTDRDANTLWSEMSKQVGTVRINDLYNVLHSKFVPEFNPFTSFFKQLPPWDGQTDHIAALASTVRMSAMENALPFTEVFRKWLVGLVASLHEELVTNHEILVFIGQQGCYKTTWFNRLLPPELQRYFYTKTNSRHFSKDDQLTMAEFALVCFEEIDTMTPSELNQLKAMTTLSSINERAAYAHNKERRAHIASFCATGNNPHFLNDPTGNRRWLPFLVESIDDPYTHPTNYNGVYSQALHLWKEKFRYWFELEDIKQINHHNKAFETPNIEEELILTYYRQPMPGETGKLLSASNMLERINAAIKIPLSPTRVGLAMKKLGFEFRRGRQLRGYLVIERSPEEVRNAQQTAFHCLNDSSDTPEGTPAV